MRRYSVQYIPIKKIVFVSLVISITALLAGIAPAEEKKGFDAKREAFCQMMMNHAEESHTRGEYQKAGYYFQQAVEADPSRMARTWFQMKEGSVSEAGTTPQPPQPASETQQNTTVIMGDDEGC